MASLAWLTRFLIEALTDLKVGQYKRWTADGGLRTAGYGVRTGYKVQTKYKTRTRYKMRTTDYVGKNCANWF